MRVLSIPFDTLGSFPFVMISDGDCFAHIQFWDFALFCEMRVSLRNNPVRKVSICYIQYRKIVGKL